MQRQTYQSLEMIEKLRRPQRADRMIIVRATARVMLSLARQLLIVVEEGPCTPSQ
jgi:hypothetical protein